jgi:hypothetical protein
MVKILRNKRGWPWADKLPAQLHSTFSLVCVLLPLPRQVNVNFVLHRDWGQSTRLVTCQLCQRRTKNGYRDTNGEDCWLPDGDDMRSKKLAILSAYQRSSMTCCRPLWRGVSIIIQCSARRSAHFHLHNLPGPGARSSVFFFLLNSKWCHSFQFSSQFWLKKFKQIR